MAYDNGDYKVQKVQVHPTILNMAVPLSRVSKKWIKLETYREKLLAY